MITLKETDRWYRNHEKNGIRLIGAPKCSFYTALSFDFVKKTNPCLEKLHASKESLRNRTDGLVERNISSRGSKISFLERHKKTHHEL